MYHEPRPHKNDWQDEKTAEVVARPVDYETDDAEVLGELCRTLKGPAAVIEGEPRSISKGLRNPESVLVSR